MATLEERIGYTFRDPSLLKTALTHSSYANERRGCECYERLECLGDSILGFVTADFLYRHDPKIPEGRMTKLRAELVCEQSLYAVAARLGFSQEMRLGHGAERTGERNRQSILADMVESVIAAIYLDGGLENARRFILDMLLLPADLEDEHRLIDHKTALQEYLQRDGECSIRYEEVSESGPDHNKTFVFRVLVNGEASGEGSGRTKKEAEQAAAAVALEKFRRP
ncbi:MAG: ribonuclease III [Oscillospiraceae bacterium]|nr:ribonuclease III [Oscillospiraceae bacterium]